MQAPVRVSESMLGTSRSLADEDVCVVCEADDTDAMSSRMVRVIFYSTRTERAVRADVEVPRSRTKKTQTPTPSDCQQRLRGSLTEHKPCDRGILPVATPSRGQNNHQCSVVGAGISSQASQPHPTSHLRQCCRPEKRETPWDRWLRLGRNGVAQVPPSQPDPNRLP